MSICVTYASESPAAASPPASPRRAGTRTVGTLAHITRSAKHSNKQHNTHPAVPMRAKVLGNNGPPSPRLASYSALAPMRRACAGAGIAKLPKEAERREVGVKDNRRAEGERREEKLPLREGRAEPKACGEEEEEEWSVAEATGRSVVLMRRPRIWGCVAGSEAEGVELGAASLLLSPSSSMRSRPGSFGEEEDDGIGCPDDWETEEARMGAMLRASAGAR
jgi:hypothetical protein